MFGEVVSPNKQAKEIAAPSSKDSTHIESRRFSDYTTSYIPTIDELLRGARSGWLTLWTNQNELGRPIAHLSAFSPTYLPVWLFTWFTDSPQRLITLLSLYFCFFAGLFAVMLCKELHLLPLAGLLTAASMVTLPLLMYWLTFPMVIANFCWSIGVLYALTRLFRKLDLFGWFVLAFCIFSLLVAARKQAVVSHAYILGGYTLYMLFEHFKSRDKRLTFYIILSIIGAAVVAGLLALPMILDLVHMASESARTSPNISFFTVVLPGFKSLSDVIRFLVLGNFPGVYGNPISPAYPLPYNGLSFTPLVLFLVLVGTMLRFRETWGWWLAIIFFSSLTFIYPFFVFAVEHLGFHLSRSFPLGNSLLPIVVIMAYGADTLVKRVQERQYSREVILAASGLFFFLLMAVGYGLMNELVIHWRFVAVAIFMNCLLVSQFDKTRADIIIAVLIIQVATISYPLMLRQNPARIATTSPLVEKVRANLPSGSRFAVAAPGLSVLRPNLNASLGLASVHSYNSLSSSYYHQLIKALGGNVQHYGRRNKAISPDYNSTMFWMSNISLMLSPKKLTHENLEYLGEESGVHLHKVISRMGKSLQTVSHQNLLIVDEGNVKMEDPRSMEKYIPFASLDQGDLIEYEVHSGTSSLLILSQKFHRDWHAKVSNSSTWVPAKTTVVNGVFQGVFLPLGTQRVRLEFKPYSRYAWIAHLFWIFLLALLGFKERQKRRVPVGKEMLIL